MYILLKHLLSIIPINSWRNGFVILPKPEKLKFFQNIFLSYPCKKYYPDILTWIVDSHIFYRSASQLFLWKFQCRKHLLTWVLFLFSDYFTPKSTDVVAICNKHLPEPNFRSTGFGDDTTQHHRIGNFWPWQHIGLGAWGGNHPLTLLLIIKGLLFFCFRKLKILKTYLVIKHLRSFPALFVIQYYNRWW